MLVGQLALVTAAIFAGAAVYINAAEQPARLRLEPAALPEWKTSYGRGFAMQASLALASTLCGLSACWLTRQWRWFIGAGLMFLNWPYTLLVILPLNRRLEATPVPKAGDETRRQIEAWGALHAVRSLVSMAVVIVFLWAGQ